MPKQFGRLDRLVLEDIKKNTAEYLKILQQFEYVNTFTLEQRKHFVTMLKAVDTFGLFVTIIIQEDDKRK